MKPDQIVVTERYLGTTFTTILELTNGAYADVASVTGGLVKVDDSYLPVAGSPVSFTVVGDELTKSWKAYLLAAETALLAEATYGFNLVITLATGEVVKTDVQFVTFKQAMV